MEMTRASQVMSTGGPLSIIFIGVRWAGGILKIGFIGIFIGSLVAAYPMPRCRKTQTVRQQPEHSNHISFRELTGFAPDVASAEALLKILKEACVEVDLRALKEWLSRSQLSAEIHALGVRIVYEELATSAFILPASMHFPDYFPIKRNNKFGCASARRGASQPTSRSCQLS